MKTFLNKIHTTSQDAKRGRYGTKSGSEHRKSSEVRSGKRDFEAYAEQLDFFFVANGVADSTQKKAVLLTNLPTETYQLAKDLVAPISLREDSLTYDTIVERLQKQLKPQKSALVARYEFDNRSRNSGETVSQYVAVLKHLATDCKFNEAMRLERLRDRLVSGIRDKKMMSELLKLKLKELAFDIAVAKCIAIEQSYKGC